MMSYYTLPQSSLIKTIIKRKANHACHYFGNKVSKNVTISGQYINHELAQVFDQKEKEAFPLSAAILNGNVQ